MGNPVPPATIRPIGPGDAGVLLAFVRELARFENMEAAVAADAASLRRALEGPRPRLEGHLAEVDGTPVGCTTFFETFSTFAGRPKLYLEDLVVTEACRGRGVGTLLFERFLREARRRGCVRAEWQVLDWNRRARALYERAGAAPIREWIGYGLDLREPLPRDGADGAHPPAPS